MISRYSATTHSCKRTFTKIHRKLSGHKEKIFFSLIHSGIISRRSLILQYYETLNNTVRFFYLCPQYRNCHGIITVVQVSLSDNVAVFGVTIQEKRVTERKEYRRQQSCRILNKQEVTCSAATRVNKILSRQLVSGSICSCNAIPKYSAFWNPVL